MMTNIKGTTSKAQEQHRIQGTHNMYNESAQDYKHKEIKWGTT